MESGAARHGAAVTTVSPDSRRPVLPHPGRLALVVFVLAFGLYAHTISYDFVWDDRNLIVENPVVATLDGPAIARMFTGGFWASELGGNYYRPLTSLSYHIDYQLYGLNASGYHATNVIANAIVCALVFVFVYTLLGHGTLALVSALLFAVHPLHTESVAWISGRTDLLAAMWSLVALILYVRGRRAGARRTIVLGLSAVAFAFALLSKEAAAFLPAVAVVLELPPCRRFVASDRAGRRLLPTVPWLAVLVIYLVVRAQAISAETDYPAFAGGAVRFLGLPLSIIAGYAAKLVLPLHLNAEYNAHIPESLVDAHILAGLAVLALIVAVCIRYRRRAEIILGACILLFGLTPVLNVIPLSEVSAERFLYLPSLGFVLMMAGVVTGAFVSLRQQAGRKAAWTPPRVPAPRVIAVLCALVAFGWVARTAVRAGDWRDEMTLFASTVATSPNSARAHLNMGLAFQKVGRTNDAAASFRRAIEIDPDYAKALSNLAGIYASQGRVDAALPLIERASRREPGDDRLRVNLGVIYMQNQRFDDAAREFQRVLRDRPDDVMARYSLGCAYFYGGRHAAARPLLEQTAGREEPYVLCYYYLAVIESTAGNNDRARERAGEFLRYYRRQDAVRADAERIAAGGGDAGG